MFTAGRKALSLLGAPRSLWEATGAPRPASPPLRGLGRAEVAVVGGGIAGLSTALHLAEAGTSVTLLEARTIGHGASGRNGGQVIPGLKRDPEDLIATYGSEAAEPMLDFAGKAADVLFDLVARHGIECNVVRHGWIQAAHDDASLRLVQDRAQQWSQRGAPVAALDADEMAALSGASGYRGGWIDRRAGRLHPLDYTRGLARAAARLGATIHEQSPVADISPEAGGWRLETDAGRLRADKVVLCMNAYAQHAWPGLERSYIPVSTFQLASMPLDPALRNAILLDDIAVSDTHPLLRYYRWDAYGRLVMGGPGSIRGLRGPAQVMHLLDCVERLFPQLSDVYRPEFFWGGEVAITLDHVPHLHDLGSGVYAYLGCNGRGVALATTMGRLLAQAALGAAKQEIPFRFTDLKPIPLHAAHPLYVQAATTYYTLRERFGRPRPALPGRAAAG